MKQTKQLCKLLLALPILLLSSSFAQETKVTQEKHQDILKKGMTWHYNISLLIPKGVEYTSQYNKKGQITAQGTLYTFKEMQQSIGSEKIEDLDAEATRVNIYVDNQLKKQQLLRYLEGSLLYYGTYNINTKNPEKKSGYVTRAPIVIYSDKADIAETWKWEHNQIPSFQFRLIAKGAQVTTSAGKFIADKIKMEQVDKITGRPFVSKEIWFTKGVGVIKEIEKQYTQDNKAIRKTLELTKYGIEKINTAEK